MIMSPTMWEMDPHSRGKLFGPVALAVEPINNQWPLFEGARNSTANTRPGDFMNTAYRASYRIRSSRAYIKRGE
jgi:hypothetical protein